MTKEKLEKANEINRAINELTDISSIFYSQSSNISIGLGDCENFAKLKNLDDKSLKAIREAIINTAYDRIKELTKELEDL